MGCIKLQLRKTTFNSGDLLAARALDTCNSPEAHGRRLGIRPVVAGRPAELVVRPADAACRVEVTEEAESTSFVR